MKRIVGTCNMEEVFDKFFKEYPTDKEMWILHANYIDIEDNKEKLLSVQCFSEEACVNISIYLDKDIYHNVNWFRVR